MKIPLKLYDGGGLDCLSLTCVFRKECANHYTAGEFRNEGGFTPELEHLGEDEYICLTASRGVNTEEGYYPYGIFPDNYDRLGRGALRLKEIAASPENDYQI